MASDGQTSQAIAFKISIADVNDLPELSELFDQYHVFYGQQSNKPACNHFLFERIINHESVIYIAKSNEKSIGFAQLYPSFSSVSLLPMWVLNDLFVAPDDRRKGVGKALIEQCQALVRERQDKGLLLQTAVDNLKAQALYKNCGFEKTTLHSQYHWNL